MLQERAAVRRLLRHADWAIEMRAAVETPAMIQNQLASIRQRWLCHQRLEAVADEAAMNQHHRLAGSSDLVLQLESAKLGSIHLCLPSEASWPIESGETPSWE